MKELTLRAVKLNRFARVKGLKTIEVHPTSTREALSTPLKEWTESQTILIQMGLGGDFSKRVLTSHEIDAVTAALTAYLYTKDETKALGDEEEGYIIIPKQQDWRRLRV
jgi:predicted nuclease with RNAse H fold